MWIFFYHVVSQGPKALWKVSSTVEIKANNHDLLKVDMMDNHVRSHRVKGDTEFGNRMFLAATKVTGLAGIRVSQICIDSHFEPVDHSWRNLGRNEKLDISQNLPIPKS